MAPPNELLELAKNYLDITWSDSDTDKKLAGILERGTDRINSSTTDGEWDYLSEGRPQELLLEYARYARSNALDEWEAAFLSELLFLAHTYQIEEAKGDTG